MGYRELEMGLSRAIIRVFFKVLFLFLVPRVPKLKELPRTLHTPAAVLSREFQWEREGGALRPQECLEMEGLFMGCAYEFVFRYQSNAAFLFIQRPPRKLLPSESIKDASQPTAFLSSASRRIARDC